MKQTIRLTEEELKSVIRECILESYNNGVIDEGKLGNMARTAALGLGLAGGLAGGMNDANGQVRISLDGRNNRPTTSQRYTRADLDRSIDSTYNVLRRGSQENDDMKRKMDADIQRQMQDRVALKRYQDSVANIGSEYDSIENSEPFKSIDSLDNELYTAGLGYKTIIKGNGSTNINDYQYGIIIIPASKVSGGVASYYTDKTPIFNHVFKNYNEMISYLPKVFKKVASQSPNKMVYEVKFTIIGLTRNQYAIKDNPFGLKREPPLQGIPYHFTKRFATIDNMDDRVINYEISQMIYEIPQLIKQYGDYQNQIRTSNSPLSKLGVDKNGRKIYQDRHGNKYTWDNSKREFVPVEDNGRMQSFTIDDL